MVCVELVRLPIVLSLYKILNLYASIRTMKSGTDSDEKTSAETQSPAATREHEVLQFWDAERIFEKSLSKESPLGSFVFYDGPPYATGMPHFGHLLPSTIKDAIPRYKTMRGFHVSRRWGWDCHGLPIENMIEKELGLSDKKAIIDYGIDKFNKAARDSVFRYDLEWKKVIHRVGRWVDMEHSYQTMDPSYTESVWWSFAKFFEKGLVYEGFKSMHVCPRCETTLSNFEVGQGYADVTDISVYVMFPLNDDPDTFMLAWTTTPWTLHGNAALAINPDLVYVKVSTIHPTDEGRTINLIFAKDLLQKIKDISKNELEIIEEFGSTPNGHSLVGVKYMPVFDTYSKGKFPSEKQEQYRGNAWRVAKADFVTAESGTGIVHIAPAFGDDDRKLAEQEGFPMLHHVGLDGRARSEVGDPFAGKMVKPKDDPQSYDIEVIKALAHAGFLYAKEKITHSYPHCWRCAYPLLNYATSGWFIETTKMRDKLIAENTKVNWIPAEIGTGRFGEWLENIRDWNLSRSRFWGAPLPVWRGEDTGKISIIGSIADLKSKIEKRNTYTLIRHGEAESNVLGIISSADLSIHGLTDLGRQQVEASIKELQKRKAAEGKKITKIYSSDFRRTRETAEMAANILGIPKDQIVFDHRLGECSGGELEGKTWGEHWNLMTTPKERMYDRPAGGESVFDVKVRATQAMYDIDAKNDNEDILVIAHGLPLRMIKYSSLGRTARDLLRTGWQDISDPNASLHEIDWRQLPHNETWEIDIHRPYVDEVVWTDPERGERMVRVPEVFDVWYDSGSMPFAQNHYPFESNNLPTPTQFPADFIAEGLDQTRGWFYSLLAINAGLFAQGPYKNVMVNGLILAEDGRKMSKSLKNYPDLWPTIEKYGADSLRFFLASSPAVRGEEVSFSEKSLDEVNKKIFNRIDNLYSFLVMYALDEKGNPLKRAVGKYSENEIAEMLSTLRHPLDLWVIARLNQTINLVTTNMDNYILDKATRPIADLIDDVSTWYLRRSRDRFKTDATDREDAIFTLRFVLERLSRIMAPVTPFMAEHLYKKVSFSEIESVHLESWPVAGSMDIEIIDSMKRVRELVEIGLAKRAEAGIKVRQPLRSFTHSSNELYTELEEILKDELNVKEIKFAESSEVFLDTEITSSLREEGAVRDLIRAIQQERKNQNLIPQYSIDIVFGANPEVQLVINTYMDMIRQAVLAKNISFVSEVSAEGTAVDFAHKAIFDPTTDTVRFQIKV